MATIKAIEGRAIHQIQSGQVIIDLCSVVKELVENSIDAGATSIDVRFKNQGLDAIEVHDNGDGISPHNYESLALKHHTSKLSTYSDLTTLQTFGFRGEALSSLCALSTFTVVTCIANDAPKGTKLEFEVSGKLKKTSLVAAQKGSTVLVENLFRNLPVRRRELERNIKREWNKVTSVLGQYACIQTGIKFSVSQQAGKGNKTTIFSTKGNQTTRENIVNVFGAKALTTLIPLDLNLELKATRDSSQTWSEQDAGRKKHIHIVGHMSRPASGDGRQTPDRQMIFVNARPCALPHVTKAFNEVYRSFNNSQSPFIFANIELDTDLYDVNVSPDKRTILLHDQNQMLENLKTALIALFESQNYTVPISQLPVQKQTSYKQLTITHGYMRSNTPEIAQTSAVESNEGGGSRVSRPAGEPSTGDDLSHSKAQYPNSQNAVVSKGSVSKDQESIILDSDSVESIKETRVGPANSEPRSAMKIPVSFSEKEWQVVEKLRIEVDHARMDAEITSCPISTSRTSNRFSPQPTPRVLHLHEQWNGPGVIAEGSPIQDEPIPARQCTTKPSSSLEDKLSSTTKSRQPPAEIANITIGDRIITSSISTPLKGVRVGTTPNSSNNTRKSQGLNAGTPSFGSSLSQRFSAPGTVRQSASESEDFEEEVGDIEEGSSSVQPDSFSEGLEDDMSGSPELLASPQLLDYLHAVPIDLNGSDKETPEIPASSQSCEVIDNEEEIKSSETLSDCEDDEEDDEEYIDEREKRIREEAKIKDMIHKAENQAGILSKEKLNRAKTILKGTRKKDLTLNLAQTIRTSTSKIREQIKSLEQKLSFYQECRAAKSENEGIEAPQAEEKLSLTISKSDFGNMRVIGQFNLGFILACRSLGAGSHDSEPGDDNVFIIDQHASDEKYNFERLHATTIVQSQRLVVPKLLHLTALEEEIVMENQSVLQTNGFVVTVDQTGQSPVGNRCQLVSLPLSRETAFSLADLEELLALLAESPGAGSGCSSIPRPSKVRKMFAMRACRSSIMIGKTLTLKQMTKVVRHLGELDKPWNCPHGRPTMRHLCRLGLWDTHVWKEGYDANIGSIARTNWAAYVTHHEHVEPASMDNMSDDDI